MQMEEVRAVLHAIFRGLLKRLDNGELRDPTAVRQGKTCHLFHKSNFMGDDKSDLLVLWIAADNSSTIHVFSTARPHLQGLLSSWNYFYFSTFPRSLANKPPLNCCELVKARQKAPAVDEF
ncbi:hypothetical protein QO004_004558 [Rhizobium mesoamericanum]|uniref:hypothetical protein n=1 Tax=Rhizobium mesoamericanum TaxID=1079800 RepID=UPI002785887F|nr:hypothetical protein [Rhizobium mesoamericanum]MDQ0562753.1 hypothetical protein [Rhizobium mesoamericanum]